MGATGMKGAGAVFGILLAAPARAVASSQSVLEPGGPQARALLGLLWLFVVVCGVVWLLVVAALVVLLLRRRPGDLKPETDTPGQQRGKTVVVGGLVAATAAILVLFTVASFAATHIVSPGGAPLLIKVTGQQWWWDVEYEDPDPSKVLETANEIHIPTGRPVTFDLQAADVIHSFWAPSLMGKQDLIPGRDNRLTLVAERPGVYRGQCAEFCGLQHARMAFVVVAETPAKFEAWRSQQSLPAAAPTDPVRIRGMQVFLNGACATCHAIEGTAAGGKTGPDLTHFGSRTGIAAGALANTPANLDRWIGDPQAVKPGANMPQVPLAAADRGALVAYLEGLK
ncbi:MAG TPA: cytochrome c oxidase subunit II [Caulobacteraceae bacterium]|jgi:cytochrome c oxidase subunit 2|nr:cytochrome c oxidase subunit II [Caulobacteraceae bacterium]